MSYQEKRQMVRDMPKPAREIHFRERKNQKDPTKANVVRLPVRHDFDPYPEHPHAGYGRPKTRAECLNMPRPCPYVSCKHHLAIERLENGIIHVWPNLEPEQWPASCVLDVVDRCEDIERQDPTVALNYGLTLDEIAPYMNLTHEAVRQIEQKAIEKIIKSKLLSEEPNKCR